MTTYLLDTHVLLWWLTDPRQLSSQAQKAIRHPENTLLLSSAAVWEMAIKRTIGRLEYPGNLLEILQHERIEILPIDAHHALAVADLELLHNDPFDRIQIVQAKIEGLTIMTRDEKIKQYGIATLTA